jgi:hypothetical protein
MATESSTFVLIKKESFGARGGRFTAEESAEMLLKHKVWALYSQTPNYKNITTGDSVVIYCGGHDRGRTQCAIAKATVANIRDWKKSDSATYPLELDGMPGKLLELDGIEKFEPVDVKLHLDQLDLTPKNRAKWGVALIGGVKRITANDFNVLTGALAL